jgi:hypothetical protein
MRAQMPSQAAAHPGAGLPLRLTNTWSRRPSQTPPNAARSKEINLEPNLFGQLTPGYLFGRLTTPNSAETQIPFPSIKAGPPRLGTSKEPYGFWAIIVAPQCLSRDKSATNSPWRLTPHLSKMVLR